MDKIEQIYKQRSELQDKAQELLAEFLTQENISVEEWMALAHELFMLQLTVDSENAYLNAARIAETYSGTDRKALIVIYGDLSGVYEDMEEYDKAHEYLQKAYNIRCEFYGKDNLFSRMSADRLKKLKIFMQYVPDEELKNELRGAAEHP